MRDKIVFIGVGNMGLPMAKNLAKKGKKVKVFDISDQILKKAKNEKLKVFKNFDDLFDKDVNFVISMLPEGKNSEKVYLGPNGVIKKVSKKCLLIDCSTIDMKTSIKIGNAAKKKGIKMIDAPVSGGVMGATKATLNIMVGGTKSAFNKALPILKIMGKNIFHAGKIGAGNGAKICNNMALGISMIAASESLMLAKRLKIDLKKVHEIMKNASGNSWPISVYPPVPGLIEGTPSNNKYRPGFSSAMMTKDLKLANKISKSVRGKNPLGKKALQIYEMFCRQGYSNHDFSAISKLIGEKIWDYPIKKK